ncbi:MAG: hypothetical protein ACI9JR_002720, partial [Gammaproteobacteria bacterium]
FALKMKPDLVDHLILDTGDHLESTATCAEIWGRP